MGAYIRRRKTQRKQVGELHKMRRLAAMATVGKMAAGGCAGILTKTLTAPLERIKILLQVQGMLPARGPRAPRLRRTRPAGRAVTAASARALACCSRPPGPCPRAPGRCRRPSGGQAQVHEHRASRRARREGGWRLRLCVDARLALSKSHGDSYHGDSYPCQPKFHQFHSFFRNMRAKNGSDLGLSIYGEAEAHSISPLRSSDGLKLVGFWNLDRA